MAGIKSIASGIKKAAGGQNPFDSGLQKLTFTAYSDADCNQAKSGVDPFQVQFNPTTYNQSLKVDFVKQKVNGQTSNTNKFQHIDSEELKLEFTLDGTGVAASKSLSSSPMAMAGLEGEATKVSDQIAKFKAVTVEYDGEKHEIPYVLIKWGTLEFKGRLSSLEIKHIIFNSQGEPLRSVLNATFSSAKDLITQTKEKANSSPDLTHIRTVKVGDTLPLMCQTIYNDSSMYLKVARFNNLVDFRNLEPGSEITFPPII